MSGRPERSPDLAILTDGTGSVVGRWGEAIEVGTEVTAAAVTSTDANHLVLCPPGVVPLPEAAELVREALRADPEVDLLYADSFGPPPSGTAARQVAAETVPMVDGVGSWAPVEGDESRLRPGFSPDRLRAQMYLGELLVVRRSVVVSHLAAGDRLDLAPGLGQINALVARCRTVAHLPRLLYRSIPGPPVGDDDHDQRLSAEGFAARAERRPDPRVIDLRPRLRDRPGVSVIMPTRGDEREVDGRRVVLCLHAIDSLIARTGYQPWELVVVLTPGTPTDLPERIGAVLAGHSSTRRPDVRVIRDDRPFNFADVCNRGSLSAAGEVLIFLNDDTAIQGPDWMDRMVMHATRPDVGAVGARLLDGDGAIQHAGIWSRGGHPVHRYVGFPADHRGHLDGLTVPLNCLAVSGACLAVEAHKFAEVGGFCRQFPSSYNDVDLCLKLDAQGYRTVVDPHAVLTHYESSTRDPVIATTELEMLHRRWRRVLVADPYDNPHHLAPGSEEYPPPDPVVAVASQRAGIDEPPHGRLARLWTRRGPALRPEPGPSRPLQTTR